VRPVFYHEPLVEWRFWQSHALRSSLAVAHASQASAASGFIDADDGGIRIFEHDSCDGFDNKYKGLFADVEGDMYILAGKLFDGAAQATGSISDARKKMKRLISTRK
jgi:hypothetical protein